MDKTKNLKGLETKLSNQIHFCSQKSDLKICTFFSNWTVFYEVPQVWKDKIEIQSLKQRKTFFNSNPKNTDLQIKEVCEKTKNCRPINLFQRNWFSKNKVLKTNP